ncbi:unnamed protein product [Allacma fusca]|uniref:Uncharacterized protein n=1 Tax=Allacma fusca TaxID=39272 RepID=A0A8J2LTU8_9HEXA|nr:unnamed protein product [Allacma fusca]
MQHFVFCLVYVIFIQFSTAHLQLKPNNPGIGLVQEIVKQKKNCLFRFAIVNNIQIVEFEKIQTPMTLIEIPVPTSLTPENIHLKNYPTIGNTTKFMKNCLVFVYLSSMQDLTVQVREINGRHLPCPNFAFDNTMVVLREVSFMKPQYYFLFGDDFRFYELIKNMPRTGEALTNPLKEVFKHLSTIFVLLYHKNRKDFGQVYQGWFFCPFCKVDQSFVSRQLLKTFEFQCDLKDGPSKCHEVLTACYSKSIKGRVGWFRKNNFQSQRDLNLIRFIFAYENYSMDFAPWSTEAHLYPSLKMVEGKNAKLDDQSLAFFPLGYTGMFKFVTSEGVQEIKTTFNNFFAPFDTWVWAMLLTFTAALSGLISIVQGYLTSDFKLGSAITKASFWLYSGFVDQGMAANGQMGPRLFQNKKVWKNFLRKILGIWLLLGFLISNGYKSIIKSNYALKFPYTTTYKTISELQDFVLYSPLTCPQKSLMEEAYQHDKIIYDHAIMCTKNCTKNPNFKLFTEIHEFREVVKKLHGDSSVKAENLKQRLDTLLYYCDITDIPFVIRNFLDKPKTAFVTSETSMRGYWRGFQEYMRNENTEPKFVHNMKTTDTYMASLIGLVISSGLDPQHHWVEQRVKTILSSGMYSFWEMSEKRLSRGSVLEAEDPVSKSQPKPLSFTETDIHLVFIVLLLFLSCSYFAWLAELVWHFLGKTFSLPNKNEER